MGMLFHIYKATDKHPVVVLETATQREKDDFFSQDPPEGVERVGGWSSQYNPNGIENILERSIGKTMRGYIGYEEGREWYSVNWRRFAETLQNYIDLLALHVIETDGRDVMTVAVPESAQVSGEREALDTFESTNIEQGRSYISSNAVYTHGMDVLGVMLSMDDGVPQLHIHHRRYDWRLQIQQLEKILKQVKEVTDSHNPGDYVMRILHVGLP